MRAYGLGPEVAAGAIGCAMEPARFRAPSPSPRKVIGYAATSGHGRDLDLVLGDLVWLLDTHADLGFELFGSLRMPEALVRFGDRALKREPIDDYDGFVATLGELGWWFGIAPLEDNAFNTCKTETKWLEYSAAGIPTLASDVAVYRRCCQGGAGILVADGAWGAEMDRMLREPSLRSEVIGAAQQSVTARYSLSRLQAQLADIFRQGAEIARRRSQAFVAPEAGVPTASPPGAWATARKAPPPAGPRPGEYERWVREFDTLDERDRSAIGEAVAALSAPPLISVVIIGEGGVPMGSRTATSLEAQLYPHWEALMPAGATPIAGFNPRLRQVPGARTLADLVGAARGRYIAFVEIDDVLAEHALALMALEADRHPDAELLYSDEDSIAADGERQSPYFKGDWNPDLLLGQDYPCRLGLVATAVARRAAPGLPPEAPAVHALMLDAFGGRAAPAVRHVPFVLYHRAGGRAERLAPPGAVAEAARRTLAAGTAGALPSVATLDDGRRRVAWPLPAAAPKVSVVIPTRDRADLLETCVEGLRRGTDYPDLEILVVDNGSREDATRRYFHSLSADRRVRILDYPGAFNFSAINNFGVAAASGDIVALLNNDIEVIHADWLREMVAQALRPDVGAVGAMLLYPDDTVQHAGIVLGVGTASHILKGQPADGPGYCGRLTLAQDVAAVTAACLVLRRVVWDRAGGLDETFVVAYNDVDLCLRIREAGYRVVWTPFARLYHHESASRGSDKEAEKRVRLDEEKRRLRARWSRWIEHDSFFSPNLSLTSLDCRPAFPPRVERMWKRLKNCAAE
jgi:GT2 family glycosyltransferase